MQKMKEITVRKQRSKRVKLQNQEKWGGYKIGIYACVRAYSSARASEATDQHKRI